MCCAFVVRENKGICFCDQSAAEPYRPDFDELCGGHDSKYGTTAGVYGPFMKALRDMRASEDAERNLKLCLVHHSQLKNRRAVVAASASAPASSAAADAAGAASGLASLVQLAAETISGLVGGDVGASSDSGVDDDDAAKKVRRYPRSAPGPFNVVRQEAVSDAPTSVRLARAHDRRVIIACPANGCILPSEDAVDAYSGDHYSYAAHAAAVEGSKVNASLKGAPSQINIFGTTHEGASQRMRDLDETVRRLGLRSVIDPLFPHVLVTTESLAVACEPVECSCDRSGKSPPHLYLGPNNVLYRTCMDCLVSGSTRVFATETSPRSLVMCVRSVLSGLTFSEITRMSTAMGYRRPISEHGYYKSMNFTRELVDEYMRETLEANIARYNDAVADGVPGIFLVVDSFWDRKHGTYNVAHVLAIGVPSANGEPLLLGYKVTTRGTASHETGRDKGAEHVPDTGSKHTHSTQQLGYSRQHHYVSACPSYTYLETCLDSQ